MPLNPLLARAFKFQTLRPTTDKSHYDGAVLFEAETVENLVAVFMSSDYLNIIVPDEKRFIDRDSMLLLPLGTIPVISRL